MRSIFKNQNETDIMAAMKVWATTLARERGVRIDPDMRVYRSQAEAERALRDKRVDALTLTLDEYAEFPGGLLGGPFFRHETNGEVHEEFVVLSRTDGDVASLKDLRGSKLKIHDSKYAGLASAWLEAQLAGNGLAAINELCASVDYDTKLSAVVLGLFFGTHDAAVVSRKGFLSMAELNPQVATQLRVVTASAPIIPTAFCFRVDFDDMEKTRFLKEVLRLHESTTGAQVLRVFKSDRMVEVTNDEIGRSLALLEKWSAAVDDTRTASLHTRKGDE